jgi:pimeloyl-ACP methyl ester carboxylesterase
MMNKTKKKILVFSVSLVFGFFLALHYALPMFLISTRIGAPKFVNLKVIPESKSLSCLSYDGLKLDGIYLEPNNDSARVTVIMLHGIRSSKEYYLSMAAELVNEGIAVLLIDHRAHGDSEGKYCTFGVKEKRDVESWIDLLKQEYPLNRVGVWGQSLGGAIGLQSMAIDKRIEFGIIESTFSELKTIGPDYLERMFAIRWKWLNSYLDYRIGKIGDFNTGLADPNTACKGINQPIIMVHGNEDMNINIKYGKQNFSALKSNQKEFIEVEAAGHANVWRTIDSTYFIKVINFIKGNKI